MRIILILMLLVLNVSRVEAVNLIESEIRMICALSSMAAYEDSNGIFSRDVLKSYKWNVEQIIDENKVVNEKLLIISKRFDDGSLIKILSISGTKDIKDAEVDFRLKSVNGNFFNENISVHQGFNDYAENVLSKKFDENLIAELKSNPTEKLYLTGHSLGGAVAILTAAKLHDLGINPNQMEVITFASPAVGNSGFADEYKDKINLTRVIMNNDPIKKSLQLLGYVQFGKSIKYESNKISGNYSPHKMIVYLDCSLRDYFDHLPAISSQSKYSVQVKNENISTEDLKYIKLAMENLNQKQIEFKMVDDFDSFAMNKSETVYYLQKTKIKNDRDENYRITLEEIKYNSSGFPISMQTSSVTTKELTTLEAVIFTNLNLLRS